MKIYDRLLLGTFLRHLVYTLVGSLVLFVLVDVFDHLGSLARQPRHRLADPALLRLQGRLDPRPGAAHRPPAGHPVHGRLHGALPRADGPLRLRSQPDADHAKPADGGRRLHPGLLRLARGGAAGGQRAPLAGLGSRDPQEGRPRPGHAPAHRHRPRRSHLLHPPLSIPSPRRSPASRSSRPRRRPSRSASTWTAPPGTARSGPSSAPPGAASPATARR